MSATKTGAHPSFSAGTLAYFASRAIDPQLVGSLGVAERNGALIFTVLDDRGTFERVRSLNGGATVRQPPGRALTPWWPRGRPELAPIVLLTEGESDALAAVSALADCPTVALRDLAVAALPGTGYPVKRLVAELQRVECAHAVLAFDADESGRTYAGKAEAALHAAGIAAAAVKLPDGADLAAAAAAIVPAERGRWIVDLLGDAEEEPVQPTEPEPKATPASPKVAPPKGFNAPAIASELVAKTPVAVGGEQLFVYRDGAYRPEGERDLKRRIALRLGADWTRHRESEVLGYLFAAGQPLWERPPLDHVNVANGILDLNTGKLEPHDPDFLSPVQIRATFDPAATCPRIERFLGEVLAPELAQVVFELIGYLLTPDQSLQVAVMMLGAGANGKSTLLSTITSLLGAANVSAVSLQRLEENQFASADLYGCLASIVADLDARALRSASVFKAITGGDRIRAERKFRPSFNFEPYARLIYSANEVPPTPDSSEAFFRRWLILPFERSFKAKADRALRGKLTTPGELSGLLNCALAALPELRARGHFPDTEATQQAAKQFRLDADSVAGFLDERGVIEVEARVSKPALFSAYRGWCAEHGRQPLSAVRFNRRLVALIPADRLDERIVQGVKTWAGLGLRGPGL